ncbi:MAG: cation:proton antiporter [Burkholderiaceae bacterium]|nr:cation:proton antiporter [Burkholderiaceae bacterium]
MLVTLVGFAFFFGILISRFGLPPMVGFLLAGFAYNLAGLEHPGGLQLVADLGVTLLLFTIGLKLNLKDLATAEVWGTSLAHVAASTVFFAGVIWLGQELIPIPLFDLSPLAIIALAFALSFSSTVYAVKVLQDKGDMSAFYGKVAIGILVMQDVFAVVFLAISEGKYPTVWALLVFLLLVPVVRKLIYKLLDSAGHGELLVLSGLFFALAAGYEFFYAVGLKGDLGALVLGVVIANHPKAAELSKSLFSLKELMLVGFFLSVGMQGLPTWPIVLTAIALVLLLPVKTFLYYAIVTRFGLRARTSLFTSLSLANFSEFSLIVAALGVTQGWLSVDWLIVVAIAVSISFAFASPFSLGSESTYQRFKRFWDEFQLSKLHPKDQVLDTGNAKVLVLGMGRVGTGAYDELDAVWPNAVLGIEHDAAKADALRASGRQVKVGDATDTDFWNMIRASQPKDLIVLAMPSHYSNVYAAHQIRNAGLACKVVAIAKFAQEVEELANLDVPSFNMYSEAGSGLAKHALAALNASFNQ